MALWSLASGTCETGAKANRRAQTLSDRQLAPYLSSGSISLSAAVLALNLLLILHLMSLSVLPAARTACLFLLTWLLVYLAALMRDSCRSNVDATCMHSLLVGPSSEAGCGARRPRAASRWRAGALATDRPAPQAPPHGRAPRRASSD